MAFRPYIKCKFCHKEVTREELDKRIEEKFIAVCDKCVPIVKDRIARLGPLMRKVGL